MKLTSLMISVVCCTFWIGHGMMTPVPKKVSKQKRMPAGIQALVSKKLEVRNKLAIDFKNEKMTEDGLKKPETNPSLIRVSLHKMQSVRSQLRELNTTSDTNDLFRRDDGVVGDALDAGDSSDENAKHANKGFSLATLGISFPNLNISGMDRRDSVQAVNSAVHNCKDCLGITGGCASCQNAKLTKQFRAKLKKAAAILDAEDRVVAKGYEVDTGTFLVKVYVHDTRLDFSPASFQKSPVPKFTKVNNQIILHLTLDLNDNGQLGVPQSFAFINTMTCYSVFKFYFAAVYVQAPIYYHYNVALYDCKNEKHINKITHSSQDQTTVGGRSYFYNAGCTDDSPTSCSLANLCTSSKVESPYYDTVRQKLIPGAKQVREKVEGKLFKMLDKVFGNQKPIDEISFLCALLK